MSMVTMDIVKLLLPNFSCQTSLVRLLTGSRMYVCMSMVHTYILLPVTNHYVLKYVPCLFVILALILKHFYGILVFPACCMSVDYSIGVHSTFMFEHIVTKIVSQHHLYI